MFKVKLVGVLCVYVCVCVCVFTSIHREGFICLDQVGYQGTDQRATLKTLNSYVDFLHRYFRMQNFQLAFQLAPLSCSHTRSGRSHDLTSARLAFRTWGLHSPLTSVAFGRHYLVSQSAFSVNTHERVANLSR